MDVKLNGVTAKTKPSSGRYSSWFHIACGRERLLGVELLRVVRVEAPEVDQLAGRVDLGLEDRLRLAEHGGGVERGAPGGGEQLGGLAGRRPRDPPRASATTRAAPRAAASIACSTCSVEALW